MQDVDEAGDSETGEPTFEVEESGDDQQCHFDGEQWNCPFDCTDAEEWPTTWQWRTQQLIEKSNDIRNSGVDCNETQPPVSALEDNEHLTEAARCHALDMAENQFFSHEGSDGYNEIERADEAGYESSYVGENLAIGQTTSEDAVEAWIESPGHCDNLMHRDYRETGAAYIEVGGTSYWVQKYGRVW